MTFIELLLAAKEGSASAFEILFGRYKNLLRKYSVINEVGRTCAVISDTNHQCDVQENFALIGGKA